MAAEQERDWVWPLGLAGALAFMIGICLGFYAIAASHPDAEVVEDAYEGGRAYNAGLRSQRAAHARGLRLELSAAEVPEGARVEVVLRDSLGRAMRPDTVTLRRERTTTGGYDADFELEVAEPQTRGRIPLPLPGRWRLSAVVQLEDHSLHQSLDLWVQAGR